MIGLTIKKIEKEKKYRDRKIFKKSTSQYLLDVISVCVTKIVVCFCFDL